MLLLLSLSLLLLSCYNLLLLSLLLLCYIIYTSEALIEELRDVGPRLGAGPAAEADADYIVLYDVMLYDLILCHILYIIHMIILCIML